MDYAVEIRFRTLLSELEPKFGPIDLQALLFLIGVQELGKGHQNFKKDDKVNLMHIAICTLLEPHGYYEFKGRDKDGWPHFELCKDLPLLDDKEQEHLIKDAAIDYFKQNKLV